MAETNPVLAIAEAGVNHNGDMDMAQRIIEEAAAAGADYVKFPTFSTDPRDKLHQKQTIKNRRRSRVRHNMK